jgi:lipoate-protein ligase A
METWRAIEEDAVSAAHGLAVDEALPLAIGRHGSLPILHLYSFVPSVIVGRYQNLEDSVDAQACKRHGYQYNRRITGGGTVMMGPDQLALGFSVPFSHPQIPKGIRNIFECLAGVFRRALGSLGIEAGFRPKNDVTIDGRKVAGLSASLEDEDNLFFHTSLCVDFDIEMMLELLKLPVEKLSDKGISCFSERMTTLRRAAGRHIDFDTVRKAVKSAFAEHFQVKFEDSRLDDWETRQVEQLVERRYTSPDWLHAVKGLRKRKGRALRKTLGGVVCVDVAFSGNIIESILLTGDFFSTTASIHRIEAALRWSSAHHEDILRHLRETMDDETIYGVTPELLADLVREAIDARLSAAPRDSRESDDGFTRVP